MREIVYMTASPRGVGTTVYKNLPRRLGRDEIAMKVVVDIKPDAFAPPVIEQYITIENPYKGIDLSDVHFTGDVITEAEAEIIRKRRLKRAAEILRANNYTVEEPVDETDDGR